MVKISNEKHYSDGRFRRFLTTIGVSSLMGISHISCASQIKQIETLEVDYSNPNNKKITTEGIESGTTERDPIGSDITSLSARARADSLAKAHEDSIFDANARDYFLSEIPNLWFISEVDTLTRDLYFRGVSSANNPRSLRHPENIEKAHTAGAIPYQLLFSKGIEEFVNYDDLRGIGRASLQSIVKPNNDFEVPLDSIEVDSVTFDIKYTGSNLSNFVPGSMKSDGTLFVLYKDKKGETTTQVVVPREIYREIYRRKLEHEVSERVLEREKIREETINEVSASLRQELKPDTVVVSDTIFVSPVPRRFDGIFGLGSSGLELGFSYPIFDWMRLGLIGNYNPSEIDNINNTYVAASFNSGNYVQADERIERRVDGNGLSLYSSMPFLRYGSSQIILDAAVGRYWGREIHNGDREYVMRTKDDKVLDRDNEPINERYNDRGKLQGSFGVQFRNSKRNNKLGFGPYLGVRGKKTVFGVRGSYRF